MGNRIGRWLLFAGTLAAAFMGQYTFAKKPDYYVDGIAYYALSAILLLVLMRQPRRQVAKVQAPFRFTRESVVRFGLRGLGLLLAVLAVVQLTQAQRTYGGIFWTWVAAIALYLLSFAARPGRTQPNLKVALRTRGWEWGLVLLLMVAALLLRAWRIDTIPWTVGGDEGSQGLWARDVIAGRLPNIFGTGWLSVPNMSFYWQAAWLRLAGDNLVGLRLPWAVVGTFTVLGAYLLVGRLFDRWLALLTAFLLATYHFHIHYSRLGSNQIADPLFVVWALYFIVVGWRSGEPGSAVPAATRRWAWAAAGVVTGLAFYFYAGSRQVPVVLIAVLGWAALVERRFLADHQDDLWAMLGGFLVVAGPMLLFALQRPNDFNARLNQVGIIQSGWLAREVQITGRDRWNLIGDQFRKAFLAFNLYKDRVVWYGASIPLMDFSASIFFVLGAVLSLSRLFKWRYAVFVIWFVLVIALGGALTENPPSSQRLVSSAVPAVFFVAVAVRELTKVLRDLLGLPELGRVVVAGALAIALALIGVRYYFGPYQDLWVYGSFNGEVATRVGYYLRDLGPEWEEYFFGAPRMYADFGSTPFIAKDVKLYDVKLPLTEPPKFVDPKLDAVFVFLPERINELALVKRTYPNGTLEEVHRIGHPDGPLLFTAYKVAQ